jgi:VWFA-related protein
MPRNAAVLGVVVLGALVTFEAMGSARQAGPGPGPASNQVRTELFATLEGQPVTDLTTDEVQILEDGMPQVLDRLDLVRPRAGDDRVNVVVFVDTYHSSIEGSRPFRAALARALEEGLSPRDRVALTSPELVAAELSFGTLPAAVSSLSQPDWSWLRPSGGEARDPKEALYDQCFAGERGGAEIAREMKARRREKASLDALDDLVAHLDGMAMGRTVVLMVSEGWRLFSENRNMTQPRRPRSGVSTPFGRFGGGGQPEQPAVSGVSRVECEADLRSLARLDHSQRLRDMSETANRSLVVFYPVNAAGLGVAASAQASSGAMAASSDAGIDSLRFLADNSGGTPTLAASDRGGLSGRLQAEGAPYYLVRYRSGNTKLDGRFRALTARTTRPDVRVRVRRGYRGPTPEELLSDRATRRARDRAAATAEPRSSAPPSFRIRTSAWASTDGALFWVVGELDPRLRRELVWTAAVKADVTVMAGDGRQVLTRALEVSPAENSFALRVPEQGELSDGDYAVRVKIYPEGDPGVALTDTARVALGRAPRGLSEPLVWRRGPSTGPRYVQTAATRFRREDRLRLEFATRLDGAPQARLVDRTGNPLQVPVTSSARADADDEGLRWVVAEVALAPLAAGDYEIELELAGGASHGFPFSIVP